LTYSGITFILRKREVVMKKITLLTLAGILILGLILAIACSSTEPEPERPTVPGAETVTMDLSLFTTASLARPMDRCADFDTAAFLVTVWGSLTQIFLALPRLAFVLALSQEPSYEGDLTWKWTFGAESNNIALTAHLVAADSVEWQMRVTNADLTNFLWYDGKCNFSAVGGWWRFYDPAEGPVLWIDWLNTPGDTTASLTLANINTEGPNFGDSLHYEIDGEMASGWLRDADGGRPGRWLITWNLISHYGRITYPEGHSACWDTALECTPCDSIPVY